MIALQHGHKLPNNMAAATKSLQSCPTLRPRRRQPTRLPRPWDSPGKNTGVGCHFLLQCMKVKSESEVTQSCPTLSDTMDCSLPGSSVHVHGVTRSRTGLSDFIFTFHFHALEKEMATHSSVLAWRIPGMAGPGGLPSTGSQSRTRLKQLSSSSSRDFPGGPVVKTLCSQGRGHGFNSWLGN